MIYFRIIAGSRSFSRFRLRKSFRQIEPEAVDTIDRQPTASTKGKLGRPMASLRVSCAFGASRGSRRHEGIDFCTPVGTSVYASESGVVTKAAREGSYGNVIFIKHGNGLETRYAHCSKLLVSAGQSVQRGQMIAKSGNTGRSTGPHLHFEVRVGKTATNPIGYL